MFVFGWLCFGIQLLIVFIRIKDFVCASMCVCACAHMCVCAYVCVIGYFAATRRGIGGGAAHSSGTTRQHGEEYKVPMTTLPEPLKLCHVMYESSRKAPL